MLTAPPWPLSTETRGPSQGSKQKAITDLDAFVLSRDAVNVFTKMFNSRETILMRYYL
jgi:hypothetical protein